MKTIIALGVLGLVLTTGLVMGDNDKHEDREGKGWFFSRFFDKRPDVAPVKNMAYKEECGSCHFAYQPGLLPVRSWIKMMADLENHFDENAELDQESQMELTKYLVENAADHASYKRSKRIMGSLSEDDTPLRITDTPYFIRKHDEIPQHMVQNNPELGSLSKCAACHIKAEKGSYEEDDVRIPGVGKWDD